MFDQRDSYKFQKNGKDYEVFVAMAPISIQGKRARIGDYVIQTSEGIEIMDQQRFLAEFGIFAKNAGMPDELLGKPLNFGTPNDPRNIKL